MLTALSCWNIGSYPTTVYATLSLVKAQISDRWEIPARRRWIRYCYLYEPITSIYEDASELTGRKTYMELDEAPEIYDKYQSANNKYQFWVGEMNCLLTFRKKEKLKDLGGSIGNILLLKFLSISFSLIKHGASFTSTKLHKPLLTLSIIHNTFSIKYIKHFFFCVWIIFLLFLI